MSYHDLPRGAGGLRVHLVDQFQSDAVEVYVLRGRPAYAILRIETTAELGRLYRWEELDPGAAPVKPTITLPADLLDAIVDARAEIRPADTTAGEALKDARDTRDRLLRLVEGFSTSAMDEHSAAHVEGRAP